MSGVKFMGKDPDGLAKAIETDNNGNIKNAGYEESTNALRTKIVNTAEVRIMEDARDLEGIPMELIFKKELRTTGVSANIMVPSYAKGFILTTVISASTGTFAAGQGLSLLVELRSAFGDESAWGEAWNGVYAVVNTTRTNTANKNHTVICYPTPLTIVDVGTPVAAHKIITMPLGKSIGIILNIDGTFEAGQGITSETRLLWLK